MPIKSRVTSVAKPAPAKPLAKAVTKPAPKAAAHVEEEVDGEANPTVTLTRSYTVPLGGDGEFMKFSASVTRATYDEASDELDTIMMAEAAKCGTQMQELRASSEKVTGEEGEEETAEEPAEEEAGEEATPDVVMSMNRDDLEAFIEANSLDISMTDYKNNKAGLTELREAVVAAAFPDDTAEEATEEAGDDEAISAEDLQAMDKPTLVKYIKDNDIAVDPKKHPKLSGLCQAVIDALTPEEEPAEEEEAAEEEAGEEAAGYSEAELKAMEVKDLKEIWTAWEMPGKFPAGPPAVVKKLAVAKILARQAEAADE